MALEAYENPENIRNIAIQIVTPMKFSSDYRGNISHMTLMWDVIYDLIGPELCGFVLSVCVLFVRLARLEPYRTKCYDILGLAHSQRLGISLSP